MVKKKKQSEVAVGQFFEAPNGAIFFKVGPNHSAYICNRSEKDGGIVRLADRSVVDPDVTLLTLSAVRDILNNGKKA